MMGMAICVEQKRAGTRGKPPSNQPLQTSHTGTKTTNATVFCLSGLALVSLLEFNSPFWWRGHHEPTGLQPLSPQRVTLDRPVSLLRSGLIPRREVTIWRHVDVQHSKSDNGSGRARNNVSRRTLGVRTPRNVARRLRRRRLAWTGILTESLPAPSR